MDTIRIYFKTKDFSKWKKLFDEDASSGRFADQAGVTKYDLQRLTDTGEISLYFELKSRKQFEEFLKSEANQKRIQEAGAYDLRFEYMERLEEKKLGGEKAA